MSGQWAIILQWLMSTVVKVNKSDRNHRGKNKGWAVNLYYYYATGDWDRESECEQQVTLTTSKQQADALFYPLEFRLWNLVFMCPFSLATIYLINTYSSVPKKIRIKSLCSRYR